MSASAVGYMPDGFYCWHRASPESPWRTVAFHEVREQAAYHGRRIAGSHGELRVLRVGQRPAETRIA